MVESTQVRLPDGSTRRLFRADVERAAADLPDGDGSRVETEIGSRHIEAVPLVLHALNLETDALRTMQAITALEDLDFAIVEQSAPVRRALPPPIPPTVPEEEDEAADLTPEMSTSLQRHAGNWVAVHRGDVLGFAESLSALMRQIGDRDATVVLVPERPLARDDQ